MHPKVVCQPPKTNRRRTMATVPGVMKQSPGRIERSCRIPPCPAAPEMQRGKNVKVKEVIESLCRLLSVLGVDSVPSAEIFRRAKFNKGENAVGEFLKLICNILLRSAPLQHGCSCSTHSDKDSQSRLVRGFLWGSGYGAGWVLGPRPQEVGSRELLLALGWLLCSGDLLEELLRKRAAELDPLTLTPTVSPRATGPVREQAEAESPSSDPRLLRRLQWLIGRLRFQRRSLLSVQEERARLLHLILSSISHACSSPLADDQHNVNSTALKEAIQHVQTLCDVLEAYLDWKHQESLFWSWMDSVLDCHLTDQREEPAVAMTTPRHQTSRGRGGPCHHQVNQVGGRLDLLESALQRLQTEPGHTHTGQVRRGSCRPPVEGQVGGASSGPSQEQVERRVALMLQGLAETPGPGALHQGYRPSLRAGGPAAAACGGAGRPGESQASQIILRLRQKEARLLERRDLRRRAQSTEIQELVGQLEGVVLIPPLRPMNPDP